MVEPDNNDEGPAVIAWRLAKVEQAVARVDKKLDDHLQLRTQIATMGVVLDGLVKSRDRQFGALTVIGTGVILVILEMIFNLF